MFASFFILFMAFAGYMGYQDKCRLDKQDQANEIGKRLPAVNYSNFQD